MIGSMIRKQKNHKNKDPDINKAKKCQQEINNKMEKIFNQNNYKLKYSTNNKLPKNTQKLPKNIYYFFYLS